MYFTQYKQMITKRWFDIGMFKSNIVHLDIIPIVNYAWARSFNNVATNKKATRGRGWGPLKKILLEHSEMACSKPSPDILQILDNLWNKDSNNTQESTPSFSQDTTSKVEIEDLNFNLGYAGKVIQSILKKLNKMNKHYITLRNQKKRVLTFVTKLKKSKNGVPVWCLKLKTAT